MVDQPILTVMSSWGLFDRAMCLATGEIYVRTLSTATAHDLL